MNYTGYKKEIIDEGQVLIAGMSALLPKGTALVIDEKNYTPATAAVVLEQRIEAAQAAFDAHATWLAKLAALGALIEETDPFVASLKATLSARFQSSPDKQATLGLAPKKPARPMTAQEKFQRVVNAEATRKARHTMGDRQKLKIKAKGGQVVHPGLGSAASDAPAADAPATAPAPAPSPSPSPSPPAAPSGGTAPIVVSSPAPSGGSNGVTNGAANGALNGAGSSPFGA